MRSKALRRTAICVLVLGLAAGCAATTNVHGYMPSRGDIASVKPGVDTAATVEEKLGLPSSTGLLQDTAWYYVESTIENYTYHRPRVIDRTVLVVSFNGDGVVTGVGSYGLERGRIVELEARTTDTGGRQLGVLEQLFGNLLNLDASQFEDQ
ncbi:outer membrane protein assembly factor BamE [Amaricoccus sp.]|uniref:outer membrane protein assembly factor BamE n=1 Tax=Amaricoccus sp. TaxID=1872485 RepID=UPI001B601551|nr:outer membrane protein assembly factor BamE [Amaricoccus sp.]MBP7000809.1 outer membrane protein assembly factor BamE [Amaricoccus sp.]